MKNCLIIFLFSTFLSCQNDNKTAIAASKNNDATPVLLEKIAIRIVKPTVEGLQKDRIDYKGFVFIGHGSSNAKAVYSALKTAQKAVDANLLEKVALKLEGLTKKHD